MNQILASPEKKRRSILYLWTSYPMQKFITQSRKRWKENHISRNSHNNSFILYSHPANRVITFGPARNDFFPSFIQKSIFFSQRHSSICAIPSVVLADRICSAQAAPQRKCVCKGREGGAARCSVAFYRDGYRLHGEINMFIIVLFHGSQVPPPSFLPGHNGLGQVDMKR